MSETSTLIPSNRKINRSELANVPTPPATTTHIPIPHIAVVESLVETLGHRGLWRRRGGVRSIKGRNGNVRCHRPRI